MIAKLRMTITLEDNPLAGLPGEDDLVVTIKGDPDDVADRLADPPAELLESPAFCATLGMLEWLAGAAGATRLARRDRTEEDG